MINIGGNPLMILLAIVAALGGVGLYFVRSFKPQLARDHDIFFSAIALVYGIILLAFNFRMEITTQLAQVLVVSFAGWFAIESLTLRQLVADQARQTGRSLPDLEPEREVEHYGRYEPDGDLQAELDGDRVRPPRRSVGLSRRMRGTPEEMPAELGDGRTSRRPRRERFGDDGRTPDWERGGVEPLEPDSEADSEPDRPNVIEIDDRDIQPLERRSRSREGRSLAGRSSRRRRRDSTEGR